MKDVFEIWHKHGNKVVIFFVAAYFYLENQKLDNKIESIEARLYDCYEDKATLTRTSPISKHPIKEHRVIEAVLPDKCKTIKECLS